MPNYIDRLRYRLGISSPSVTSASVSLSLKQSSNLTPVQKANAVNRMSVAQKLQERTIPIDSIIQCLNPITDRISNDRRAADEIRMLAPEVDQASAIMVSSIMSPNDLQDDRIGFEISGDAAEFFEEDALAEIVDTITQTFTETIKLPKLLPKWLDTALYRVGAQPLIVIPETELDHIINSPDAFVQIKGRTNQESVTVASEALRIELDKLGTNLSALGRMSSKVAAETKKDPTYLGKSVAIGLEDYSENSISDDVSFEKLAKSGKLKSALEAIASDILSISDGRILDDNPEILKKQKYNAKTLNQISKDIVKRLSSTRVYKENRFIDLGSHADVELDENMVSPLFMEVPAESIVPVYMPSSPSDHIGYFLMVDPEGNPIVETDTDNAADEPELNYRKQNLYDSLFKTMGLNDLFGKSVGRDATNKIYNLVVDEHIRRVLNGVGLNNLQIGNINNIYKCMFSRYLKNAGTRLLFIPKEFCIYFAFEHHADGTGKSKLENVKFALSMRITLLVCSIMAAIRDAADRKIIRFQVPDKAADPLSMIKRIQRIYTQKNALSFSVHNPDSVRDSLNNSALSIVPEGIPGMDNFRIEREQNSVGTQQPDMTVMNDVVEMNIHALGVPPAALNRTGEDEYARSVATMNLFFNNQVRHLQDDTCEQMNRFVRTYLRYTYSFVDYIRDKLSESDKFKAALGDNAADDATYANAINTILDNISMTLPTPNIAPTRAQHEELNEMLDLIERCVEMLFHDRINEQSEQDPDVAVGVAAARNQVSRAAIEAYINTSGSPILKEFITASADLRDLQQIKNLGAKMRKILKSVDATANDPNNGSDTTMF